MPTYEYECTKCGVVTEVFQAITESTRRKLRKTDNPECDCHASVTRLIGTGAGIIFKGSGFYQTDYRSESYKKAAEADKQAATGKTSKDDSKPSGTDQEAKSKDTKGSNGKGEQVTAGDHGKSKSPTEKKASAAR